MRLNTYRSDVSVLIARALREVKGEVEYPGDIEYIEELESELSDGALYFYHKALNHLSVEEVNNVTREVLAKTLTVTVLTLTAQEAVKYEDTAYFKILLEVLEEQISALESVTDEEGAGSLRILESIIYGLYQPEHLESIGVDIIGISILNKITETFESLLDNQAKEANHGRELK